MAPRSTQPENASDGFRLHYVQGTERCVVAYDSPEAALRAAFKKLRKNPEMEIRISDAGRQVLFDASQLRARLAESAPGD